MDLIPAIDLIGGRCVRLSQGDYQRKTEYGDPVEIAKTYEEAGIRRLHLVDLDGAKGNGIVNLAVLSRIAKETRLVIDFGGGVKDEEQLRRAFDAGAAMVTCGSIAAERPDLVCAWKERFGSPRLIIGCDVKDGYIATHGWKKTTSLKLDGFIDFYLKNGLSTFICTDISRDGMLSGPALDLYAALVGRFPSIRLIASGGVGSMKDIIQLSNVPVAGVIIGKALYEGGITLEEVRHAGETYHSVS